MSLDPFEARLQFLKLVRTLNASQQSIQKVVSFAVKYGARCGEDLWECVGDEISKASLNARINILYLLDSLTETSSTIGAPDAPYLPLIERSLPSLVSAVVPNTREGLLNARSARLILESWRARRVLDPAAVDAALKTLAHRVARAGDADEARSEDKGEKGPRMSRNDILRRIEEDRERQKRLRERMWILPIPPLRQSAGTTTGNPSPASPSPFALTPASPRETPAGKEKEARGAAKRMPPPPPPAPTVQPLDIEFEQMWEAASDLDEDDFERMRESASAAGLDLPS